MSRVRATVRNPHAVLRIMRLARRALPPPSWPGPLTEPVDPMHTHQRMRATSLLAGIEFADGTRHPDVLTLDQAQDVLRWAASTTR